MGGKIHSPLSQETLGLFGENKDYFDPVVQLKDKTQLKVKLVDPEARTETKTLPNGDVEVTFIYPLDNNDNTFDGRIYLQDKFIFDGAEHKAKGFQRDFSYNGSGENKKQWREWLALYQQTKAPSSEKLSYYAQLIAHSYARPFSDQFIKTLGQQKNFLVEAGQAASAEGLKIKIKDPRSHFSIINRGLTTEVIFSYEVQDSNEATQGHLVLQDKFVLNGNSGDFLSHERAWKVAPGSPKGEGWEAIAARLNQTAVPEREVAKKFFEAFQKEIFNKPISQLIDETYGKAPPPEGGYQPVTAESFEQTMNAMVASDSDVKLADLDLGFFAVLKISENYFTWVRDTVQPDLSFDLKNPQVTVNTQVEGKKTYVQFHYQLREGPQAKGYLQYNETLVFEGETLKKIERSAQVVGEDPAGKLAAVQQKIQDKIQQNKLPQVEEESVNNFAQNIVLFVAPHLYVYPDRKKLIESPEIPLDKRAVLVALQEVQENLVPLLHLPGVDPHFRGSFLSSLNGLQYGDVEYAGAALAELGQKEGDAIKNAGTEAEKFSHQDNLLAALLIGTISSGDFEKAKEMAEELHSPDLRSACMKPIEKVLKQQRMAERLEIIAKVASEQIGMRHAESTAWLHKGPVVNVEAEGKVLDGLMKKAASQIGKIEARGPLGLLKKIPDLDDKEKAMVERLAGDPLFKKISLAALEADREIQAENYFYLAKNELYEKGYVASAQWLTQKVALEKLPPSRSQEGLDIIGQFASESMITAVKARTEELGKKEMGVLETDPKAVEALQKQVIDSIKLTEEYKTWEKQNQTLEGLMTKAGAQSQANPTQGVLEILQGLGDLTPEEAKVRNDLIKDELLLPIFQSVSKAATLPNKEDRLNVYQTVLLPLVKEPQLKAVLKGYLESLFKEVDAAPTAAGEGVVFVYQMALMFQELKFQALVGKEMEASIQKKIQDQVSAEFKPGLEALPVLLEIARQEAVLSPDTTAFSVLKGLDAKKLDEVLGISGKEKKEQDALIPKRDAILKLRDQLLQNKLLEQFSKVAEEADPQKRAEQYIKLLQSEDMKNSGLKDSGTWLVAMIQSGKIPPLAGISSEVQLAEQKKLSDNVHSFLAFTHGKGSTGINLEYGTKHFAKECANPRMMGAMVIAGLAGPGMEALGLRVLSRFGTGGRIASAGIGAVGEGWAFTTSHKALDSAFVASEHQWDHYWKDVGASAVLFGGIRFGHGAVTAFSNRFMATGAKGFGWAGGHVAGEPAEALVVTPAGRVIPTAPRVPGKAVPQLSVAGQRVTGLLQHSAALGSMVGGGYVNRKLLHLEADNGKDFKGNLADALLMYVQCMVGFNLANRATGGRFQAGVAGVKLRLDLMRSKVTPKAYPTSSDALLHLVRSQDPLDLFKIPHEVQLSLAKKLAKTQELAQLFENLHRFPSPHTGKLAQALRGVFEGGEPLAGLPTELGIRAQAERLMKRGLEKWQQQGFNPEAVELKPDARWPDWTDLEVQYHTGAIWDALRGPMAMAGDFTTLARLLEASPLATLGRMRVETVIESLKSTKEAMTGDLAEMIPDLGGLRQRVVDILEIQKYRESFAQRPEKKFTAEEKILINLVKRYVNLQIPDDYGKALEVLRYSIDQLTPQARILLMGVKPKARAQILEAYVGESGRRNLPSAKAQEILALLHQTGSTRQVSVAYRAEGDFVSAQLLLGDPATIAVPGRPDYILARLHPNNNNGKDIHFEAKEVVDAVKQAKAFFKLSVKPEGLPHVEDGGKTYQTWVVHKFGASELTVELNDQGEVTGVKIRYGFKIGANPEYKGHLNYPAELRRLLEDRDFKDHLQIAETPYTEIVEGMPFSLKSPRLSERAIAAIPAFPEFKMPERFRKFLDKGKKGTPSAAKAAEKKKAEPKPKPAKAKPAAAPPLSDAVTNALKNEVTVVARALGMEVAERPWVVKDPRNRPITTFIRSYHIDLDSGERVPLGAHAKHEMRVGLSIDVAKKQIELEAKTQKAANKALKKEKDPKRRAVLEGILAVHGMKIDVLPSPPAPPVPQVPPTPPVPPAPPAPKGRASPAPTPPVSPTPLGARLKAGLDRFFGRARPAPDASMKRGVAKTIPDTVVDEPVPPTVDDPNLSGQPVAAPAVPKAARLWFVPARSADPVTGPVPELPSGWILPVAQIVMGERVGPDALPPERLMLHRRADMLYGELAGKTDEGEGYKDRNEDMFGVAYVQLSNPATGMEKGDMAITVVDGMGGHAGGKEAAQIGVEKIHLMIQKGVDIPTAYLQAHNEVRSRLGGSSGAVAVTVLIKRPRATDAPSTYDASWVGDPAFLHIGNPAGGGLFWKYRSVEDGVAMPVVDMEHQYGPHGANRTLLGMSAGNAHIVTQSLGPGAWGGGPIEVRTTENGEVPDFTNQVKGVKPADGLKNVVLEENDILALGSDGWKENFGQTRFILKLMEPHRHSAQEMTMVLNAEGHLRMKVKQNADGAREQFLANQYGLFQAGQLNPGQRVAFQYEGRTYYLEYNSFSGVSKVYSQEVGGDSLHGGLRFKIGNFGKDLYAQFEDLKVVASQDHLWIDEDGRVFAGRDDKLPVDHLKNDNFTVVVYLHNPRKGSTPEEIGDDEPTRMVPRKVVLGDEVDEDAPTNPRIPSPLPPPPAGPARRFLPAPPPLPGTRGKVPAAKQGAKPATAAEGPTTARTPPAKGVTVGLPPFLTRQGHEWVLKMPVGQDNIIFGRAPGAEPEYESKSDHLAVRVPQSQISGRHALFQRNGNTFTLTDLDSTNGTFILLPGGKVPQKIDPNIPVEIKPGYRFFIGPTPFLFEGNETVPEKK